MLRVRSVDLLAVAALGLVIFALAAEQPPGTPVCLQADNFRDDGDFDLSTQSAGSALVIEDLRWSTHEECERFVIELDGGPGDVDAAVIRDLGLVRVHLEEAIDVDTGDDPATAEYAIGGELAEHAYVVRHSDGSLYVDLHLASEAEAAVMLLGNRVIVDLRAGGESLPTRAEVDDSTVLLSPREGDRLQYPLHVRGYARHFEGEVVLRAARDGELVGEEVPVVATDRAEAWGEFSVFLTAEEAPPGRIELEAGEYSAEDGSWQGVAVGVEAGRATVVPGLGAHVSP